MRILLPSVLLMAACTPSAGDLQRQADRQAGYRTALDRELAGLTPGQPQSCIEQTRTRDSRGFGDTIVYSGPGDVRYVTRTSGGCEQYGSNGYIVTRTPSTSLCRGDIATVVDRSSRQQIGACSFGDFVPYSRAR
ncbi:hypothetical protein [Sphingomonas sp.]|uniref:hypothetical protein n=1 Tax=Sphingomonas sp. TaxID=28214 RepID=UPI003B008988